MKKVECRTSSLCRASGDLAMNLNHKPEWLSCTKSPVISCAHEFWEEPQVPKKLLLDPTVVFWVPAAPPKTHVHTSNYIPLLYFLVSLWLGAHFDRVGAHLDMVSYMSVGRGRGDVRGSRTSGLAWVTPCKSDGLPHSRLNWYLHSGSRLWWSSCHPIYTIKFNV